MTTGDGFSEQSSTNLLLDRLGCSSGVLDLVDAEQGLFEISDRCSPNLDRCICSDRFRGARALRRLLKNAATENLSGFWLWPSGYAGIIMKPTLWAAALLIAGFVARQSRGKPRFLLAPRQQLK